MRDPRKNSLRIHGDDSGTEDCAATKVVGFIVHKDGTGAPARRLKIYYNKTGILIVSYVKDGKPWNGRS